MKIHNSVIDIVGGTPLLRANGFCRSCGVAANIILKLEYLNPFGSAKDRIAKAIVDKAERDGRFPRGGVIIEPTSGNTGIALAAVAAARGYRMIAVMPEDMSAERIRLIKAYGAQVVLTDKTLGMRGAVQKAEQLRRETDGAIIAGQFSAPANPEAHYRTTGPEIWRDTGGNIDILVAGVGTGGTISGAGKFIKENNPHAYIAAVEPSASPVLGGGEPGKHGIAGIGAGFVPRTLDTSIFDEVIAVTDDDAIAAAKRLAACDGVLVGISSGAALFAAARLAARPENENKMIVAIMPDSADRYYSTRLFDDEK